MTPEDFDSAFRQRMAKDNEPPVLRTNELIAEYSRREWRWIRILTIASIVFWALAVIGMLLLVIGLNEFMMGVRLSDEPLVMQRNAVENSPAGQLREDELWRARSTQFLHRTVPLIIASLAALFLAALSTVQLIRSSRGAILNHIQAHLIQISNELQAIEPAVAAKKPPDSG